jgi:predicted peroxiredoxin|tara:strand:+ start:785 stop:1267 length:483 start_codon:yes stop_codon:yes gene_type:complete
VPSITELKKVNFMRILTVILLLASTISFSAFADDNKAGTKPKLLSFITSDNTQTQLMGMVLSSQALKQGAEVNILLCGQAGDIALIDAPQSVLTQLKPKNMSPQSLMKNIIKMGGTVQVCALYLPNRGVKKTDLIEGITPALPPHIAKKMLDAETKVISF